MRNLFIALLLTGFLGVAAANTVLAMSKTKVVLTNGEKENVKKRDKTRKRDKYCCKSSASQDCSPSAKKKCCMMPAQTKDEKSDTEKDSKK